MNQEPIVTEATIDAPVHKVWAALTDPGELQKWSFDIRELIPETGFEFRFTGSDGQQEWNHVCVVTDVIPLRKFAHTWRYQGYEGNTLVTYHLTPLGNTRTHVKLTHEGLGTFPVIPALARQNFEAGWKHIIGAALPQYLAG